MLESGNVLYTVGSDLKSQSGVGFLVHKEIAKIIIEFKSALERVAMIIVRLNSKSSVKIIQVYAPTSTYGDEVVEIMYNEINSLMDQLVTHYTMIIGDFNVKIGQRKIGESKIMGRYGIGD